MSDNPIGEHERVFRRSLNRCSEVRAFFDRFLERFQASCSGLRRRLGAAELERQIGVLKAAFYCLLLTSGSPARGEKDRARERGKSATAGRGKVAPEIEALWLESLLGTVKECDPQFDGTVERAWRDMIVSALHRLPPEGEID